MSRAVIESIADAVNWAFAWMIPVALAGFVVTLVMRAEPLRDQLPTEAEAPIAEPLR